MRLRDLVSKYSDEKIVEDILQDIGKVLPTAFLYPIEELAKTELDKVYYSILQNTLPLKCEEAGVDNKFSYTISKEHPFYNLACMHKGKILTIRKNNKLYFIALKVRAEGLEACGVII